MSIKGNPCIVATNGTYDIICRGDKVKAYTILKKGDSLESVRKWKTEKLLSSMLIKGGYSRVNPPKKYVQEED